MTGLLNYTTGISATRTITEMQTMLVEAGVTSVTLHYDPATQQANGFAFEAPTKYGSERFVLLVNVDAVRRVLQRQRPSGSISKAKLHSPEQAERVAWRVARSWLEAQLAMIKIGLATIDQIMLPYLQINPDQTMYAAYQQQREFLQIEAG